MTSSTRFRAQFRTGIVTRLPGLISISLLSCAALLAICGTAAALDCDHCRRELVGQYTVYEGKNLHDRCYYDHYAQYCGICGQAITGQYYHNTWGDVVHAFHIGEFPSCEYCSRLTAEKLTGKGSVRDLQCNGRDGHEARYRTDGYRREYAAPPRHRRGS